MEFVVAAENIRTAVGLQTADMFLTSFFSSMGWAQIIFTYVPLPGQKQESVGLANTIHPQFYIDYDKYRLYEYDMHHMAALKLGRVFSRSRILGMSEDKYRARLFDQLCHDFRFETGVIVPIFDLPVRRMVFAACGPAGPEPTEYQMLAAEHVARAYGQRVFEMGWVGDLSRFEGLSSREREVLQCVSRGLSSEEISARVGIATPTVNLHVQNAQKKMQAKNRTEAVARAVFYREISPL